MKRERVVKTEEYYVCDVCGEEIKRICGDGGDLLPAYIGSKFQYCSDCNAMVTTVEREEKQLRRRARARAHVLKLKRLEEDVTKPEANEWSTEVGERMLRMWEGGWLSSAIKAIKENRDIETFLKQQEKLIMKHTRREGWRKLREVDKAIAELKLALDEWNPRETDK